MVNEKPNYVEGYISLAQAHLSGKEYDLAVDTLKNALKSNDRSVELMRALSRLYTMHKDYAAAEDTLRKIIEYYPEDLRGKVELGDFFVSIGEMAKGEKIFAGLKEEHPENPAGYMKHPAGLSFTKPTGPWNLSPSTVK